MTLLELLILAAASWYIAFAVTSTSGPFHVFEWVREFKGGRWHGRGVSGKVFTFDHETKQERLAYEVPAAKDGLLDCIICLSIWVALILRLIGSNVVTDAFAIAGVALWIHAYSSWIHIGGK